MSHVRAHAVLLSCILPVAACQPSQPTEDVPAPRSQSVTPSTTVAATASAAAQGDSPSPLKMVEGRLTDASGLSVYVLKGNADGSKCDAVCEDAWPPVLVNAAVDNVEGAEKGTLATRVRPDGTLQLTYRTQPLYRYAGDGSAHSTSGHGLKDKWGEWSLADAGSAPESHGATDAHRQAN